MDRGAIACKEPQRVTKEGAGYASACSSESSFAMWSDRDSDA